MPGQGRYRRDVGIALLRPPRGRGEYKNNTILAGAGKVSTIGREGHDRNRGRMPVDSRFLHVLANGHRFSLCRGMCDNEDFDSASCTWQIYRLLWRRGFYINMIIMVGPAEFHR